MFSNLRRIGIGVAFIGCSFVVAVAVRIARDDLAPHPSPPDVARIEELRSQFGKEFDIEFQGPNQIRVRKRLGNSIDEQIARTIYISYRFRDYENRIEFPTEFHAFNFYSASGGYLFQLVYSPSAREIRRGRGEF